MLVNLYIESRFDFVRNREYKGHQHLHCCVKVSIITQNKTCCKGQGYLCEYCEG